MEESFEGVVKKCVCLNSAAVAMVLRPRPAAYVQFNCKLNGMSDGVLKPSKQTQEENCREICCIYFLLYCSV